LDPVLFNIYTNDQPEFLNSRRFIYADDLYKVTQQSQSLNKIEHQLIALDDLSVYYIQ